MCKNRLKLYYSMDRFIYICFKDALNYKEEVYGFIVKFGLAFRLFQHFKHFKRFKSLYRVDHLIYVGERWKKGRTR